MILISNLTVFFCTNTFCFAQTNKKSFDQSSQPPYSAHRFFDSDFNYTTTNNLQIDKQFYDSLLANTLVDLKTYEETKNDENALILLRKYDQFSRKRNLALQRDYAFAIEHKNFLSTTRLGIMDLKKRNQIIFWIIFLNVLLLFLLLVYLFLKNKIERKKTERLILHIEEATTLQITKIEYAEAAAKDQERKKIGEELHDDLASTLAGIQHFLQVQAHESTEILIKERYIAMANDISNVYKKVRLKSHEVYNMEVYDNFADRIAENVHMFFYRSSVEVKINIDKMSLQNLVPEVKTALLYTLKEAITNILKHANATRVQILLYGDLGGVNLELKDNGSHSFDFFNKKKKKGLGFVLMQKRLEKVKGKMNFTHDNDGGTTLTVYMENN